MAQIEIPRAFFDSLSSLLGDEMDAFRAAMLGAPDQAFRLNPLKPCEAAGAFAGESVPWETTGYYVRENTRPGLSLLQAAGAYYIQDASAMAAVAALDHRPGEVILDLCAAPGGKSTQIAGRLMGEGFLLANEIVPSRAKLLSSALERFGAGNCAVTNASPEDFSELEGVFDRVLVDAPCSGEGMFRKNPEAIGEWSVEHTRACAVRQRAILDAAAPLVRRGGVLAYSTCTFNEGENEGVINAFLSAHPEYMPEEFALDGVGKSVNGCLRLWPHRVRGEGHFVCRLRRQGDEPRREAPSFSPDREAAKWEKELKSVCSKDFREGVLVKSGEYIELVHPLCPDLGDIKCVRRGVQLARLAPGRLEPAHQLAMCLTPGDALRAARLDAQAAVKYMKGETIARSGEPGWTLVTYEGLPLGWGKQTGDMLKNHLPKGLRGAFNC
ncbi:MAG: RsmB/NOP family class I SAM-dependent RNA methyltransferase [Clostridiales bacterium]|nr:RsmB/NOP family class I SAM-dependent RNA methyltransferase [Clostridiales bacterium]